MKAFKIVEKRNIPSRDILCLKHFMWLPDVLHLWLAWLYDHFYYIFHYCRKNMINHLTWTNSLHREDFCKTRCNDNITIEEISWHYRHNTRTNASHHWRSIYINRYLAVIIEKFPQQKSFICFLLPA